jgi:hypothetical protein
MILFILLFTPSASSSQQLIDQSKAKVKKELKKYVAANNNDTLSVRLAETDSSLLVSVTGPTVSPVSFYYSFDRTGKCISQETKASCESCLEKFLSQALERKEYKWRKINENQYVSRFSKRLLLEIPAEFLQDHPNQLDAGNV